MDRGAWRATVYGAAKRRTRLSNKTYTQAYIYWFEWINIEKIFIEATLSPKYHASLGCKHWARALCQTNHTVLCIRRFNLIAPFEAGLPASALGYRWGSGAQRSCGSSGTDLGFKPRDCLQSSHFHASCSVLTCLLTGTVRKFMCNQQLIKLVPLFVA